MLGTVVGSRNIAENKIKFISSWSHLEEIENKHITKSWVVMREKKKNTTVLGIESDEVLFRYYRQGNPLS